MCGRVVAWNGRFGFIDAGEGLRFFFVPSELLTEIAVGDEVCFWLDDDHVHHGRLMAVEISRRGGDLAVSVEGQLPQAMTGSSVTQAEAG